jgi:glutamate--cysteine ligase
MEALAEQVDVILAKVRRKYKEYGIKEKPFAVVKADNGTYGMGVMTVRDAKELARCRAEPQQDGRHQGRPDRA